MRKPPFVTLTLTLALAVLARGASANSDAERARLRQLIDAAVAVVAGGNHPEPTYKWSDEGDRARTIAKNSMLADSPSAEAVKFLRDNLPINFKIVDGGKQHVLKNVVEDGRGVYQQYPPLADFVKRWTEAFGREVDVKLELSLSTPVYYAIPGGPITIYDAKHSPSAVIDVDDEVNNESRGTENLDRNDW